MSIEAMKQALEALRSAYSFIPMDTMDKHQSAESALRQAIEQAENQEPFAWIHYAPGYKMQVTEHFSEPPYKTPKYMKTIPVYTALPTPGKEWVHLTHEEFKEIVETMSHDPHLMAIELEIRIMEKNTCTQP